VECLYSINLGWLHSPKYGSQTPKYEIGIKLIWTLLVWCKLVALNLKIWQRKNVIGYWDIFLFIKMPCHLFVLLSIKIPKYSRRCEEWISLKCAVPIQNCLNLFLSSMDDPLSITLIVYELDISSASFLVISIAVSSPSMATHNAVSHFRFIRNIYIE